MLEISSIIRSLYWLISKDLKMIKTKISQSTIFRFSKDCQESVTPIIFVFVIRIENVNAITERDSKEEEQINVLLK